MTQSNRMLWKVGGGVAGLALLLVILVATNLIISRLRLRVDLTEENLYTLSDGTRQVMKKLSEPVTLKLFFSRSLPDVPVQLKAYATQVEDVLHEYRLAGGSKVILEVYDPEPDSDAEESAQRYGVSPQSMDVFSPPAYFGLVAVSGDREGTIPALDPRTEGMLEYNITRLIYRVAHPEQPVVGVMSALPVLGDSAPAYGMPPPGGRAEPWLVFQEIREDYDLRRIETDVDRIPDDVEALIVVHPKEFPPKTLYAIDQFVLRGGRLLAFVDPFSVADLEGAGNAPSPFGRPDTSSDLGPLLAAWGIGYDKGQVLADMKAISRLRGEGNRVEESPVFLTLQKGQIERDDILTAQLSVLMLPFAGGFTDNTTEKLTVTPLITSSDLSALVPAMTAQFGAQAINRDFKPDPLGHALAVRITGEFPTAYPNGKPKDAASEDDDEDDGAETQEGEGGFSSGRSAVILVADADLLYDRFCVEALNFFGAQAYRPLNDNAAFFANAVEQVAGSEDLIGIRSRGDFFRPFDRVTALEDAARRQWREKEQSLEKELQETRSQLSQLQTQKDQGQAYILSPEQKKAIARFRDQERRINGELKDVRKNLRRDIERLGVKVKVVNIVLMPLLISLVGVVYGLSRRHRG
jgi:ABC-type uncharacterized transport system involved in gliding motility auxiliary subunit